MASSRFNNYPIKVENEIAPQKPLIFQVTSFSHHHICTFPNFHIVLLLFHTDIPKLHNRSMSQKANMSG